tara:strand:+ start:1235 stop:1684 length:450 start_codon:yes stop_codon:yes gene_type:complete
MECLSREQLLLLQNHLPYTKYEEFMDMFKKEETLPEKYEERTEFIVKQMEEHHYWGEWYRWGEYRVYRRIPKDRFQGFTKHEYLSWLHGYLGTSYLESRGITSNLSKKSDIIRFLDEHEIYHKQKFGDEYPTNINTTEECYPVDTSTID